MSKKKPVFEIMLAFSLLGTLIALMIVKGIAPSKEPTDHHKALCMQYAMRDHEKEMSPERWEYLKQFGDPNDVVFFYESCLGHVTGKPATKEYMK